MLSAAERERYSRHLLLPEIGISGQETLRASRVLIVGAGGLGSPAALYLAAAGIGTLALVDHDRVELSNLHRQILFDTADLGAAKAGAGRLRLAAQNPEITVRAHEMKLGLGNAVDLINQYDLVVDGSDRLATRYLVNDVCVLLGKPLVSAAIHRFEGQAMTYVPRLGPCYRCLFPKSAGQMIPNCATAGVLGVLPGVLGSLQALEAIKVLTGIGKPLIGRFLTFDALDLRWQEFQFARRVDCAVCGEQPTIRTVSDSVAANEGEMPVNIERLEPHQLRALMIALGNPVTLIDVREPHEFAVGHLAGSQNIPLGELPRRMNEIPLHTKSVFICRSGGRSLAAAMQAERAGRGAIAHLEGGLLEWAASVDSSFVVAPLA